MVQKSFEKSTSGSSCIGMLESLRDAKAREFELLKQTEGMSVLEYDTKERQII